MNTTTHELTIIIFYVLLTPDKTSSTTNIGDPYNMKTLTATALVAFLSMTAFGRVYETQIVPWGNQAPVPADIKTAVAISTNATHSVALMPDGTTRGWGNPTTDNRYADFTAADLATYVRNGTLVATRVLKVVCGGAHTVYWLNNGMVVSRGSNTNGRLGVFPFAGDPASYTIIDVAATNNGCAVAYVSGGTNSIRAWGVIAGGDSTLPRFITSTNPNNKSWNFSFPISKMEGGNFHIAWVMNNGTAGVVTGYGDFNSLPLNSHTNNHGAIDLACGDSYTLWIRGTNVYGAGFNHNGLGILASNVKKVSAGNAHELYLTTDATVTTSPGSSNSNGQATVPVGLAHVVGLDAGPVSSLALVMKTPIESSVEVVVTGVNPKTVTMTWPGGYPEFSLIQGTSDLNVPFVTLALSPTHKLFTSEVTFTTTSPTDRFYRVAKP